MCSAERTQSEEEPSQPSGGTAVVLRGTVTWARDAPPVLHDVDLVAQAGDLVVIVGATGSGKTTLLNAVLGLTEVMEDTHLAVRGRVAYVSQQAYIFGGVALLLCFSGAYLATAHRQSQHVTRALAELDFARGMKGTAARAGTVQDNILFDLDWSPGRYERAVAAANLNDDLEQLPAGDQTELGEGVRFI